MVVEIVSIINCADAETGAIPRPELRRHGGIYRVNYILVFNAAGQILAQRRSIDKDLYPGKLDLAAGGVVSSGESYEASAKRELAEELGVSPPLTEHFNLWFENTKQKPINRTWGKVFSCTHEGPFTLQESEVESGRVHNNKRSISNQPQKSNPRHPTSIGRIFAINTTATSFINYIIYQSKLYNLHKLHNNDLINCTVIFCSASDDIIFQSPVNSIYVRGRIVLLMHNRRRRGALRRLPGRSIIRV